MSIKNIFTENVNKEKTLRSVIDGPMNDEHFYGDIWADQKNLTSLKGSPKTVDGDFVINRNPKIKSLEGCPEVIKGEFQAKECGFTSMEHGPKEVEGFMEISFNKIKKFTKGFPETVGRSLYAEKCGLTTLEGIPSHIGMNGGKSDTLLILTGNELKDLKGIHKHLEYCKGAILLQGNPIKSHILGLLKIRALHTVVFDDGVLTKIMEKYLPEGDLLECQQELIDAGYEDFAQL